MEWSPNLAAPTCNASAAEAAPVQRTYDQVQASGIGAGDIQGPRAGISGRLAGSEA